MKLQTRQTSKVVGLDIEAGSVAATEVTVNGSAKLSRSGVAALAPGIAREGEIADPKALGEVLKKLFAEQKLSRSVRVGIANQRVVVRTLQLPMLEKDAEIEAAVRFQAPNSIPMPLEQAVIDWQVIEPSPEAAQAGMMEVVVVAARRETVAGLIEAVSSAGLKPVGIDVAAFGMIRALPGSASGPAPSYEQRRDIGDGVPEGPRARLLCNLGDVTNLAVARGDACVFTRISSFGMEGIAQRLAERRGLTLEHSRQWLMHVGLDTPAVEISGDPEIVQAAREALEEGVAKLAGELRLSLEYYGTQENAVAVDEIVVCGTGAVIAGLPDALGRELGYPLQIGRPPALASLPAQEAARLTIPFGLALQS